ncbi:MAG: LysR family transcriptional regulator [Betaproteobacteria bacterium]|nr:LysR family transcriptional regulator [Betaproteobacteria bacterium]
MELYQLRTLVTVAQEGHLTRAAERLHISQPAVSAHIKALEEELGLPLFERRAGGMALTAGGQALLAQAEKVLSTASELLAQARGLKGQVAGKVRFGTIIDPEFLRLGEFLAVMLERYPLLRIELHHGFSGWVFDNVRDGKLDAGFFLGKRSDSGIARTDLRELTFRIVAPPAWRERVQAASLKDIAALPWVWGPRHSAHFQMTTEMFGEQGLEPAKTVEADNESVMLNLVASGVGMCFLREELAHAAAEAGQVMIWGKARAQTTLSFIYPAARGSEPVISAMTAAIRAIWGVAAEAGS